MDVDGKPYRSIRETADGAAVEVIDQTRLPHEFAQATLHDVADAARAIAEMWVRGAPLIGATAAWGLALAMRADPSDANLAEAGRRLVATRPTAVNLRWAIEDMEARLVPLPPAQRAAAARARARALCDEDAEINRRIGAHGMPLIEAVARARPGPVRILTHCNAGWLATVDWGTATAPIYRAHAAGIPVEVWVDETRPRNQGAHLTAWEMAAAGIPHRLVVDNAGGHLMQRGLVDMVIVGTDRTTARGDVCNKIGTYLKALAARDNGVPFYVALPSPTIDWRIGDGMAEIEIEERGGDEVAFVHGRLADGSVGAVRICPEATPCAN
ncbi:MAG: S-methyl-5-thioribose-1-phosphate isomerase, partial [Rhodobacteraceae bacterium]|nr:S-methyl-5-thioribose-1-phosphate isomerase [Paracoccaceae bacterium]